MTQPFDNGTTPRLPQPRQSLRVALSAEVVLKRTGHGTYRVKINDLSPHGCKAEFVERPALGETVWVKFDSLEALEAAVCWIRGFEVGLEFKKPFHRAVFEMLIERLKT